MEAPRLDRAYEKKPVKEVTIHLEKCSLHILSYVNHFRSTVVLHPFYSPSWSNTLTAESTVCTSLSSGTGPSAINLYLSSCSLSEAGKITGARMFQLFCLKEKSWTRHTRIVQILYFLQTTLWKELFGSTADSLERSTDHDNECILPY